MFPSRAPSGRKLAFTSSITGNAEIYTINIDGSGLRQVTHNSADGLAPAWSPDGRRITSSASTAPPPSRACGP
jgi:TolB protein